MGSKHEHSPTLSDDRWLIEREKAAKELQQTDPRVQQPAELASHLPHDFRWNDLPPTPLHMAPGSVETLPPGLTPPEKAFLKTMRHYEEIGNLISREGGRLGLSNHAEIGQALEQDGLRIGHQMLRSGGADSERLAVYGREVERPVTAAAGPVQRGSRAPVTMGREASSGPSGC